MLISFSATLIVLDTLASLLFCEQKHTLIFALGPLQFPLCVVVFHLQFSQTIVLAMQPRRGFFQHLVIEDTLFSSIPIILASID